MRKLILIIFVLLTLACLFVAIIFIPSQAAQIYGPPASSLSLSQRVQYSAQLLWYDGLLTRPLAEKGGEQNFTIELGESVNSVAAHLQEVGLIRDSESFRLI